MGILYSEKILRTGLEKCRSQMVFLIDHADLQDGFIPSRRCDTRGIAALEEIYGEGFKMKGSGILLYIPVLFGDIR